MNLSISKVAVLDEFGAIVCASKPWHRFEESIGLDAYEHQSAIDYFDRCRRIPDYSQSTEPTPSLADDLQLILTGEEVEFHRRYSFNGLTESREFVFHAARFNLPTDELRILMTQEDGPAPKKATWKSETRLNQLLDTTKVLAWEADPRTWRFSYVSDQAVKLLGYSQGAWYEPGFFVGRLHPDDRRKVLDYCQAKSQVADHYDLKFRILANDNRVVWVHNLVTVTRGNGGPRRIHGFMVDISERKRSEADLRDLGGRLIAAQEEERSRLARELHDDLSQRMAVLSIGLEQLSQQIPTQLNLGERFQTLLTQVKEISSDIHRISYRLHPSKLDHLGLEAAARSLCEELEQSGTLKIDFQNRGLPPKLPKDVTLCLFRIVQEALRNCVKHSGAKSAQVVLEKTEGAIRLTVSDKGRGFDTESKALSKGLGFISMRERLRIVGGAMHFYSQPGKGLRIDVSVPLNGPNRQV